MDGRCILEGQAAQKKFLELITPGINEKGLKQGRTSLLEYCKRDTLAMVKLAHFLQCVPDTLVSN